MTRPSAPCGYRWRSQRLFVIIKVGFGLFSDLFLYAVVVPIMPFVLRDRLGIDADAIQTQTSRQLAAYAGSSVLFAVPAGWEAEKLGSRKLPLVVGIAALLGVSVAVVWTVGFATIQDLVGARDMGRVTGSMLSLVSVGELAASALGGWLYDAGGMQAVFALCAAVLLVDMTMRLLMLDRLEMERYKVVSNRDEDDPDADLSESTTAQGCLSADETSPVLQECDAPEIHEFRIPENAGWLARNLPVLFCMRNSRLSMAMAMALVQGIIFAAIDATVPIQLTSLFSFTSKQVGMTFACMVVPLVGLGPAAGWAVDRCGPRAVAMTGYALLVPAAGLFSLPSLGIPSDAARLPLFCVALALNGVALALTGPISYVEAGSAIDLYQMANPGFFGKHGPSAQLYGFNSLFFFLGLAIGRPAGGWLSEAYGFHVMALVFAGIAAVMLVLVLGLFGKTSAEGICENNE
ncbi:hypothetical protein LLEC1_01167 [Akanthomyces lecanii]|uniref:Major facilitator superfamily (MFS) profile domain-containing protein n=1 Tax=Cordyceps confragosa TaxID=2714763 RepID=A0A179I6R1_CORDF|nr:hypothetical protein LLEC1_01167 [Akanthomyces lecanii]